MDARHGDAVPAGTRRPVDQTAMRAHNLGLVLRYVRDHGSCSRAQIGAATRLTTPAVTKIVADLLRRGLLEETGPVRARGRGRPASMLRLHGRGLTAVGVEIRVDHVGVLVRDFAGTELASGRRPLSVDPSPRAAVRMAAALVDEALDRSGRADAVGCGVALPALVDAHDGTAVGAHWASWNGVPIRDLLADALGERCGVLGLDSAARLAALATSRLGEFRGSHQLVHLEVGAGAGVGATTGGALFTGAHGYAGAFGHIPMDPRGPVCTCGGAGCLNAIIGFPAFARDLGDQAGADECVDYARYAQEVAARIRAGDATAREAVERLGRWLGRAVAILVNLLDPDTVTVGGYVLHLQPWLMDAARAEVAARVRSLGWPGGRLEASPLTDQAALLGAVTLALEHVFADPTTVAATAAQGSSGRRTR